jgi:hypothetical protein
VKIIWGRVRNGGRLHLWAEKGKFLKGGSDWSEMFPQWIGCPYNKDREALEIVGSFESEDEVVVLDWWRKSEGRGMTICGEAFCGRCKNSVMWYFRNGEGWMEKKTYRIARGLLAE